MSGWGKKGRKKIDISYLKNGSIGDFFGKNQHVKEGYESTPRKSRYVDERPKTAAELSKELVIRNEPQHSYTIGGVPIKFPCKPYPSQFSMMDKIVKGLERSVNCLLESPTGSGKSLALLCSVLAWQQAYKDKVGKEHDEQKAKKFSDCCCTCHRNDEDVSPYWPGKPSTYHHDQTASKTIRLLSNTTADDSLIVLDSDEEEDYDDDFKKPAKKIRSIMGKPNAGDRSHISIQYDDAPLGLAGPPMSRMATPMDFGDGLCNSCQCWESEEQSRRKIPKIFFGTRTHKQIAQIARELAKTAYREARMCILSSREQTCSDPEVSRESNKTEACKLKREGPGCMLYENVRKVTHRNLEVNGLENAWDMEDFMKFNKKHKSCPYFGARQLREDADIVFCPYNYLIDPVIRDQMQINLKGDILILDEAHNMEDVAREAASYSVTEPELEAAMTDFNRVIAAEVKVQMHARLKNVIEALGRWVTTWKHALDKEDYDNASKVWLGVDMVSELKASNIGPDQLPALKVDLTDALEDDPNNRVFAKILMPTAIILEKTFYMLEFIYRNNYVFMNDYRIALTRTSVYKNEKTDGEWLNKGRSRRTPSWLFTLHFWCMNPAVAFSDLHILRSIILTSGTLSPMSSFQSELGRPFPIQLEANHVINAKQVWVGAVSRGPRGHSLLGTYQNAETFTYQDEVGELVLNVCKTVPHGVLCFLSSYRMLDKLLTRWQNTGLYAEMGKYKVVMREPRTSDRDKRVDFDALLHEFYSVIKNTEHLEEGSDSQTGAFLMAVCRGKVSEGMDFADNNARAVITVGIPFPSIKDTQVELKKKYNNEHTHARGLLTGSDWYEIQAYRAINQALGRCIRHRYDWGALILVDERFGKNPAKYSKGLSKWIRNKVQYHGNFNQAIRSLQEFTENMVQYPPAPGQDTTLSVSQMDLSMVVQTNHQPGAVGPPAPVSTPLPADTLPSNSFLLASQAGGFLASQPKDETPSKSKPAQWQPPKFKTETNSAVTEHTITTPMKRDDPLAGPPRTQAMNLDQTLEFNSPLAASTQRQDRHAFKPAFTSTQVGTRETTAHLSHLPDLTCVTPIKAVKTEIKTPKSETVNHNHGQLNFDRSGIAIRKKLAQFTRKHPNDDDPDFEMTKSSQRKRKACSASKKASKVMNIAMGCSDEELLIDDRSNSPLLFGSEEVHGKNTPDVDAVLEYLADTSRPKHPETVSEVKQTPRGKLPLFKPKPVNKADTKNEFCAQGDINENYKNENIFNGGQVKEDTVIPPIDQVVVETKSKNKASRLSRRRSNESMGKTPNSKNISIDLDKQKANLEDEHNNSNVTIDTKPKVNENKKQHNATVRMANKRIAKGVDFESSDDGELQEELVTKRATRVKRRRLISSHPHEAPDDLLEDLSTNGKKMDAPLAVCCKNCGIRLTPSLEGIQKDVLPGYVAVYLPSRDQRSSDPHIVTCDQSVTCLKMNRCIEETSSNGIHFNSVWNDEVGCCIRFYCCPSSQCSSRPVAACITAVSSSSSAIEGQVWFLPHMTKTAEPT